MPAWKRFALCGALVFSIGVPLLAQGFRAGASIGLVNDVEHNLRLDEFHHHDVNVWVDFVTEDKVAVRLTFGSLKVKGSQGGNSVSVTPGAPPEPLPDLTDRMNYALLSASYEFFEGDYTSGIFVGAGGYRVEPESVDPAFQRYQDAHQTVFGWHAGLDGSFRLASRLSFLVRGTYHNTRDAPQRSLLTANAGFVYRF